MTEIRMLRRERGAPNFVSVVAYEKDWQGDVPEHLAKAFCEEMDPPAAVRIEAKAIAAAPENKMMAGAEENKTVIRDMADIFEAKPEDLGLQEPALDASQTPVESDSAEAAGVADDDEDAPPPRRVGRPRRA